MMGASQGDELNIARFTDSGGLFHGPLRHLEREDSGMMSNVLFHA